MLKSPYQVLVWCTVGVPPACMVHYWCAPCLCVVHCWCAPACMVHCWCAPACMVHCWCPHACMVHCWCAPACMVHCWCAPACMVHNWLARQTLSVVCVVTALMNVHRNIQYTHTHTHTHTHTLDHPLLLYYLSCGLLACPWPPAVRAIHAGAMLVI